MFLLTITSVVVVLQSVQGEYNYRKPDVRLELPNNFAGRFRNGFVNPDEKELSSLWSYKDYNYPQLQKYGDTTHSIQNFHVNIPAPQNIKINPGNSQFVPIQPVMNSNLYASESNRFLMNSYNRYMPLLGQGHDVLTHQPPTAINAQNVENLHLVPNLINANSNIVSKFNLQNVHVQNNLPLNVDNQQPCNLKPNNPNLFQNIESSSNVQTNIPQFLNSQSVSNTHDIYRPINDLNNKSPLYIQNKPPSSVQNVSPVITKNIYFHVPPPEFEETLVQPVPEPPKKTYKIILIKLPSQSGNTAALEAAYNKLGLNDDKTLIYVLVNNQDKSSQVLLPSYRPSEHEVLFVKYKGKDVSER